MEALAPFERELISISSGLFHENGDEVKEPYSQNLQVKKGEISFCFETVNFFCQIGTVVSKTKM